MSMMEKDAQRIAEENEQEEEPARGTTPAPLFHFVKMERRMSRGKLLH